jgi:predicted HAD superfamily Cof-like phosphohydrolase
MARWTMPEWATPTDMVKEFHKLTDQVVDASLYATLIDEEQEEFQKEKPNTAGDLKELADLVYVCHGYAIACGYNLDEALKRVHENNVGRCLQPDGTVQRRADGKIMKNPDYPKVYLGDLL